MDLAGMVDEYSQPAWRTAVSTAIGYGLVLLVMTVLLFGLPYLVFVAL